MTLPLDARSLDRATRVQLDRVTDLVRRILGGNAVAGYLHGSAASSGLRHDSDVDVLIVVRRPTTADQRRELISQLLPISGRRAAAGPARSIELTIVVESDVRPWRYPPRLDFQYGDWWRHEFEAGEEAPWQSPNLDLTVVVAAARVASEPLWGPPADELLDRVPAADLTRAMLDGIPDLLAELESDTRNVLLTLARIWTTAATGEIRSKDAAATWALTRLPGTERRVLERARAIYLGEAPEQWGDLMPLVRPHAERLVGEIHRVAASAALSDDVAVRRG